MLLGLLAAASPAIAQTGSRLWRPDERVVLADLATIDAVAISPDVLYLATAGGLAIYDRRFARWEPPLSVLDGYPADRVVAALVDPLDRSVWLGTPVGVVHYVPAIRTVQSITIPGGVMQMMFDRDDAFAGLYVRGRLGWQFLPRGGAVAFDVAGLPPPGRRLETLSVDQVLNRAPHAMARAPMLLLDERMRRYRYTAGAIDPQTGDLLLGTDGGGALLIDAMTTSVERLRIGLLDRVTGAVLAVPGGVWSATGEGAARRGLSFVSDDLQRFAYEEGPATPGYRFAGVRDLLGRGPALWAATDRGVLRVEPGGSSEPLLSGMELGTAETYALAQGPGGVWVGTRRGLALVTDSGDVARVDQRVVDPIFAVAAARDTVWLGGLRGLGVTWWGSEAVRRAPGVEAHPALSDPIVAVTLSADTVVAATQDLIAWRAPDADWVVERVVSGELGALTALAPERAGVWVAGTRGIAFYRFAARAFTVLNRPGDLPGPARDLAVDRRYLWVATDEGLVRFDKQALLP